MKIAPQQTGLQFSWDGVTNAASFQPGLPPGGGLASLFVEGLDLAGDLVASGNPLPTELAGVSVLSNGTPSAILSITRIDRGPGGSGHQINFQVPFRATGTFGGGLIEVRYRGLSTWADPIVVGPGIFTLADGSPAIQHASDYSLVTAANPAVKGETIIVYAT